MQPLIYKEFKDLLLRGLEDDGYSLDWTSLGIAKTGKKQKKEKTLRADIIAKADGVFFGEALGRVAESVAKEVGLPFQVKTLHADGTRLKSGMKVFEWSGSALGILALERPFLNLLSYFGGIATRTRGLSDRVEAEWKKKRNSGSVPRVTATRKILPYYRDGAIAAIIAGGGFPHRVNLSGGVLIKENHIAAAGGIREAITAVRSLAPHLLKTEVEVRNLTELKDALGEKAEVIMLDNFTPAEVAKAIRVVEETDFSPIIECSGGISEETIAAYAISGVHILSVGGLTHTVKALDFSLLCRP